MKNIKDLTEQDCIHCATQEEWDGILAMHNPNELSSVLFTKKKGGLVIFNDGMWETYKYAHDYNYTIHPASDFLTPQVSVLTEIGDTKVIRHNDGCIVIKDDKSMTLSSKLINWIKQNI